MDYQTAVTMIQFQKTQTQSIDMYLVIIGFLLLLIPATIWWMLLYNRNRFFAALKSDRRVAVDSDKQPTPVERIESVEKMEKNTLADGKASKRLEPTETFEQNTSPVFEYDFWYNKEPKQINRALQKREFVQLSLPI